MVILTINAPSNDYTVYFDHPIPKPNYMRLISCSLYNSWFNFMGGKIILTDKQDNNKKYENNLLPGFYTVESLAEALKKAFLKRKIEIETIVYTPTGVLYLKNPNHKRYNINIGKELAELFEIEQNLPWIRFVKKIKSPAIYSIHCDLIDKEKNLLNGKPSSILARFDVKGKAYEKITYKSDTNVLRDTMSGEFLNSLTISVRDEHGELFNFIDLPLHFELQIL